VRIQTLKNQYILLILTFGSFGLLFASIILRTGYQQYRSQNWPHTPGKVTESGVNYCSLHETYSLAVRYTYVVEGRRYVSDRFDFYNHSYTSSRAASAKLSAYTVGSTIRVYYDPHNFQKAVLSRQVPVTLYLIYGLMIGLLMTPIISESRQTNRSTSAKACSSSPRCNNSRATEN
jgi:Protein of unknown function (DUF3592)